MRNFLVSVVFITYNHEPFIRQSLDGVLMQETDFPVEIVAGEDCSTDGTRKILLEYKERYPDRIRLLFRERNLGRPTLNVYLTWKECRGKYVAFLEGDDYWTDKHKLKRQIDFLEEHGEYIGVTHGCALVGKEGEPVNDGQGEDLYRWSGDFTMDDYRYSGHWPGQTATVVCRNLFLKPRYDYSILYKAHDFLDDGVILLFLLLQGKIYRMDEVMSCWRFIRKEGEGNWNSLKLTRNAMAEDCYTKQRLLRWVEENVGLSPYGRELARKDFVSALSLLIRQPSAEHFKLWKDMYPYNIRHVVKGDRTSFLLTYTLGSLAFELWKKLGKFTWKKKSEKET